MTDTKSWLNQDLLGKLAAQPDMMRAFADPKVATAIQEMQRDPAAAMAKYKDDAYIQKFLKSFASTMSEHMGKLGADKKESKAPQQEELIIREAEEEMIQ